MTENIDLSEIAIIKIKIEAYTKLYEQKAAPIKEKLKSGVELVDPEHGLEAKLVDSGPREFSIPGIKQVLGAQALLCIEEKVNAIKFDALTKKGEKYLIDEEKQKLCFTKVPRPSLIIEGLDVYKAKLQAAVVEKSSGEQA